MITEYYKVCSMRVGGLSSSTMPSCGLLVYVYHITIMGKYQYHIFSPYRVCPLGAHVDHQHGLVTGFAIDKGVDLWFDVREDSLVKLSSRTFEGDEDCIGGRA